MVSGTGAGAGGERLRGAEAARTRVRGGAGETRDGDALNSLNGERLFSPWAGVEAFERNALLGSPGGGGVAGTGCPIATLYSICIFPKLPGAA